MKKNNESEEKKTIHLRPYVKINKFTSNTKPNTMIGWWRYIYNNWVLRATRYVIGWTKGNYPPGCGDLTWESVQIKRANLNLLLRDVEQQWRAQGVTEEDIKNDIHQLKYAKYESIQKMEDVLLKEREFRWKYAIVASIVALVIAVIK